MAQRGQAMMEYSLISLTVVLGFAVAYYAGLTDVWTRTLNDSVNSYYITVPIDCTDGVTPCVQHLTDINFQYQHR
ncbi:MAG: hypothetical protein WAT58_07435 [Candidatus Dormiibacterota bacterium]